MSVFSPSETEVSSSVATGLSPSIFEQGRRLFSLETPLGKDVLLLETLHGRESVSGGGFCLDVTALSSDAHLRLNRLTAQPALIRLRTVEGSAESDRLFHGFITASGFQGANGGFARYALRIEPWLAFLRYRKDSYLFQDKTVFDIIDELFQSHSALFPVWRWDIADASLYPKRSLTTQYRESDFAFLERLLAEEGLYYWFEHAARDDASLGRHTLVIADHPGAWRPNAQEQISWQRADVTEPEDSLIDWQSEVRLRANALVWHSWDYKSVNRREERIEGDSPVSLIHRDDPGIYAWEDRAQAERLQKNALLARQVRQETFTGVSTVRTLKPGSWFELTRRYEHDAEPIEQRQFIVLSVEHHGRNNFSESFKNSIIKLLGPGERQSFPTDLPAAARLGDATSSTPAPKNIAIRQDAIRQDRDYWNTLTAIRRIREYRPCTQDGHGRALHPKPTIRGVHSALVIADEQDPIHTDRDHRIKVQFHWQRGSKAVSRQGHPAGDDNAPGTNQLGVWVRVSAASAGDNWGSVFIPRMGQEVLVEYLHGDIDRPVITGALYNGEGETDQQTNRVQNGAANATGNAPAWFAGIAGEHGHSGIYSGIKTQALGKSQDGAGDYNQLLFDDTPGQTSLSLASAQKASRLALGQQRLQNDNRRGTGRGHGAELASLGHGAVRGGEGVLISADQSGAEGSHMDSAPAAEVIRRQHERAKCLADNAQKQNACLEDDPDPGQLPAIAGQRHSAEVIESAQTREGHRWGGNGEAVAYREAQLQYSAPGGVFWATPKEVFLVNEETGSLTAGEDVNIVAGSQSSIGVAEGIALYAVGEDAESGDPIQEKGLRFHAAHGNLDVRSLKGATKLTAEQTITLASTETDISIHAPEHVRFNAAGAQIKLTGNNLQIYAPGKVTFKAAEHLFMGPNEWSDAVTLLPTSTFCLECWLKASRERKALMRDGTE
jgi:Rhs element Vgr protein